MNADDFTNPADIQKHLSEEQTHQSHKKKDGPTSTQKRKHQITYLAHQVRFEQEVLLALWDIVESLCHGISVCICHHCVHQKQLLLSYCDHCDEKSWNHACGTNIGLHQGMFIYSDDLLIRTRLFPIDIFGLTSFPDY